ncbi:MAG TPA: hypothetical protein VG015_01115, partial [Candidatus Dormibacteraeota bacterium]|nr:hypothetical protein [Candidatus Dormibacteraeota bacterium]
MMNGQRRVESNARLTAQLGMLLLILLAVEGFTILGIQRMLPLHIFVGFLVVPPLLLKMGSTTYRFVRYYTRDADFRAAGPPAWAHRLLGPVLIFLTMVLMVTGIGLWLIGYDPLWVLAHKASFVAWFGLMTIHVLGHLNRAQSLAWVDWRHPLTAGRLTPRNVMVASFILGLALG